MGRSREVISLTLLFPVIFVVSVGPGCNDAQMIDDKNVDSSFDESSEPDCIARCNESYDDALTALTPNAAESLQQCLESCGIAPPPDPTAADEGNNSESETVGTPPSGPPWPHSQAYSQALSQNNPCMALGESYCQFAIEDPSPGACTLTRENDVAHCECSWGEDRVECTFERAGTTQCVCNP